MRFLLENSTVCEIRQAVEVEISEKNRLEQNYSVVKEQRQGNHVPGEGFLDSAGKGFRVPSCCFESVQALSCDFVNKALQPKVRINV